MTQEPAPTKPGMNKTLQASLIIGAVLLLVGCLGCVGILLNLDQIDEASDSPTSETTSESLDATETTSEGPDTIETTTDTQTSESPEEVKIKMPSVVDKNAAVAQDELEKLGFTDIQFGSADEDHNTIGVVNPANWTVVEQSHKEGDKVASDAVIVLTCVKN